MPIGSLYITNIKKKNGGNLMRVRRKIKINTSKYSLRCKIYDSSKDAVDVHVICVTVCRGMSIDDAITIYNNESGNVIINVIERLEITEDVAVLDAQEILNKLV